MRRKKAHSNAKYLALCINQLAMVGYLQPIFMLERHPYKSLVMFIIANIWVFFQITYKWAKEK